MDGKPHSRGRLVSGSNPDTLNPENLPRCKYCKALFRPLPNNAKKQTFCCESHRKMHWKYGAMSIGKLASRIERNMKKYIESEMRTARREAEEQYRMLNELQARVSTLEAQGMQAGGFSGAD